MVVVGEVRARVRPEEGEYGEYEDEQEAGIRRQTSESRKSSAKAHML